MEVEMPDLRSALGNQYLRGFGVEIGAGLSPTAAPNISGIAFIDKRSPAEVAALFGRAPDYEILTPSAGRERFSESVDFIVAHHVIEHCDDPIGVLVKEWLPMLKTDGLIYLSLPSARHSCEQFRLPTPIGHVLDDYYFERPSTCYESKDHIYSFVLQWTVHQPGGFPFANSDVISYATEALRVPLPETQDLHWHTYTLPVASQMVEAAFWAAGFGLEWLCQEETENEHHLIARRITAPDRPPQFLAEYRDQIATVAERISSTDSRVEFSRKIEQRGHQITALTRMVEDGRAELAAFRHTVETALGVGWEEIQALKRRANLTPTAKLRRAARLRD
jgi:SAM-dependent methyltransferase